MAGTYVSGTQTTPYILSDAATQDPFTLGVVGLITVANGVALTGDPGTAWTVLNEGRIEGKSGGIIVKSGGTIGNAAAALIAAAGSGGYAIQIIGGAGVVTNAGSILGSGSNADGIALQAGGSVGNSGTITGNGVGVQVTGGAATITNSGTVEAARLYGIVLKDGGTIDNQAGGLIYGAHLGVLAGSVGQTTITNAGTIAGGSAGTALELGATGDRLIIDPLAVFVGEVLGAADGSTLELASAASAGTLTGIGTSFVDFTAIAVDAGATWTLTGVNTIGSATLTDAGTLINAGRLNGYATLQANAYLLNQVAGTLSGGVTGAGTAVSVTNLGSIFGSGDAISLTTGGTVTNGSATDNAALVSDSSVGIVITGGGSVNNAGTIIGYDIAGVFMTGSATLSNGSTGDTAALIASNAEGAQFENAATVMNYGTIAGNASIGQGVFVGGSGTVVNASSARIEGGAFGVQIEGIATVTNSGTIAALAPTGRAVALNNGGTVANGTSASIVGGYIGVQIEAGSGSVTNLGTIAGIVEDGIDVAGSGLVTNGSETNPAAAITAGQIGVVFGGDGTVANDGTISGTYAGVFLLTGGVITNGSAITPSALITGDTYGVRSGNGTRATLTNFGTINGGRLGFESQAGIVTNAGTIVGETGLALGDAATVTNTGLIAGTGTTARYEAVYLGGGTLINAGTITAASGKAVVLADAAARVIVDPGASFGGGTVAAAAGMNNTLELASGAGAGTLTGLGTNFVDFTTVEVDAGATWTLTGVNTIGSATLTDAGTLINIGSLSGYATLQANAYLLNQASGTLSGGVRSAGTGVSVTNLGSIVSGDYAISLSAGGSVTNGTASDASALISGSEMGIVINGGGSVNNAGTIIGYNLGGVVIAGGGTVTNQSSGTIIGFNGIVSDGPGTIVNAGSVSGRNQGVSLARGGSVTNQSGGMISGGIFLQKGGSVTNEAGATISGADAVVFGAGYTGHLIIDPGAVFTGMVDGGNVPGASFVSTLELASGADSGTLAGLGSQFVNFADIVIDSGASWVLASETIGADETIINAGTIGGDLPGIAVELNATGDRLVIDPLAAFVGEVLGTPGRSTLELASGASAGTLTGLGTKYIDFPTITVDAGANWTLIDDTIGAGYTIIDAGGMLTNVGSIGSAVTLAAGATLSNLSGGTISGFNGIVSDGPGTIVNAGSIAGSNRGVGLARGGSVTNLSGGMISGGVFLQRGGSVTNQAGATISGTDAVVFGAGYTDLLVIDPGAVFLGTVDGGNAPGASFVSTLELASGASAGTLTGLGSQFTNFGSIAFDQGADWFVEGNTAGLVGSIGGFAAGDTIEIDGITVTGSSYADGVLTLDEASGSASLNLVGDFTTNEFLVTNVAGGAEITALCFCVNTLINTPAGARPVQDLMAGDLVTTFSGAERPIAWVGIGSVLATRGRRSAATPVIVRKGALGDNVPYLDLRVTKGHSFLVDDVLIPVEFLVNHRSILWDDRAREVRLYHIELETHDVLVANGAPAESYRDDGNRWLFQNANTGWDQPTKPPCAPVLVGGPIVDSAWRRLLDRAGGEVRVPLTEEADLHLLVDGVRVDAVRRKQGAYIFSLAVVPESVRIVSRAAAPQELGLARDPRILGVALRQIALGQGARLRAILANDPRLVSGFHQYESDNDFVWTNGDAAVPADLLTGFSGPVEIVLMVASTTRYIDEGILQRAA